jgi:hypothetical protein
MFNFTARCVDPRGAIPHNDAQCQAGHSSRGDEARAQMHQKDTPRTPKMLHGAPITQKPAQLGNALKYPRRPRCQGSWRTKKFIDFLTLFFSHLRLLLKVNAAFFTFFSHSAHL